MAEVKVLDAGSNLMLSSTDQLALEQCLQGYLERGSIVVTQPTQVGSKWVCACTLPDLEIPLQPGPGFSSDYVPPADSFEDVRDGCRVEKVGFKSFVYGPTREQVSARVQLLKQFGAELVGEIEQQGDEWVALCDSPSARASYRW